MRGAVDAERVRVFEHVCLQTNGNKASTGRHGRKRSDDDQAVAVEDVETGVTSVGVTEESVDTVMGDSQLRLPLVELRESNEFPESLGDEGESWVMASWHTSYDIDDDVFWKRRNQRRLLLYSVGKFVVKTTTPQNRYVRKPNSGTH